MQWNSCETLPCHKTCQLLYWYRVMTEHVLFTKLKIIYHIQISFCENLTNGPCFNFKSQVLLLLWNNFIAFMWNVIFVVVVDFFHKHGRNFGLWKQNMVQEENKSLTDIFSTVYASQTFILPPNCPLRC